ncbi:amidohydrolase family protein [Siphonobacter sp. SORGH_AS_0500]|uniref:amidohydrolase family protein n=1 Tax=Siphonobacter sp. SORGH_AS_0500 TaxID=1864824 RepID=UPI00285EFDDA|nr:amidohydrolase family protein [Siphonobacter sp. SORGH_AS_0500]MDR6196270.1 N-acyl-D-aspartate/D-glutamate deacylase [Siphonobacter sp. SORGH_AS_0500]
MNRRKAISQLSLASVAMCTGWAFNRTRVIHSPSQDQTFPIVIQKGSVFTEGSLQKLNVGVTEKGTLHLSPLELSGTQVINAEGKIVSPGFIDILADGPKNLTNDYHVFERFKLTDGVTTTLQLHGGRENPGEYHRFFDPKPHYTNYGVGIYVMGIRLAEDLPHRLKHVEKMLAEGALSVSHSLEYQPTPYWEVKAYAKLAKRYERPMFLHLRYSNKENELMGVKEAIRLAQETGVHLHIDHLHSTGGTFHMPEALDLIDKARQSGLAITTCVYPYTYWATYLHSKRFDEGWQQRYGLDYNDLQLVGTNQRITPESFQYYRKHPGYLVAVPEGAMPFESTIDLALQTDFCMIGSDGGMASMEAANSHPRGAGCFATAIQHAQSIGLPLEKILPKITQMPADLIHPAVRNRGEIKEGAMADVTIFDPKTIQGRATVEFPNRDSAGIEAVILNGKVAYLQGQILAENGLPIRNTAV